MVQCIYDDCDTVHVTIRTLKEEARVARDRFRELEDTNTILERALIDIVVKSSDRECAVRIAREALTATRNHLFNRRETQP